MTHLVRGRTLTIDTSSTIEGAITLGGLLSAEASSVAGATNTLILNNPIALESSGGLRPAQGITLDLAGPISEINNQGTEPTLEISQGTVELSGVDNAYSGGTELFDNSAGINPALINFPPSALILAARGAAGLGAIGLNGQKNAVMVEAGASGNPDGNTYVAPGSGSDTISAVDTPVVAVSDRVGGTLLFYNGSAPSTVSGSTGSVTIFGGGGGQFFGGTAGNNLIVAGAGPATLGGGGNGDQLWANGSAGDLIAAGSGNETLGAGNSTGSNVFFGGSGNDVILAGAGNDLVVAGPGTPTIFGGATGNTAIFAGSGADLLVLGGGADYVQFGTGNSTTYAGTGGDLFGAYNGQAGGSDVISGFKNGVDHIALRGYGAPPAISHAGGNTTITLSDNTQITLLGIARLATNTFV